MKTIQRPVIFFFVLMFVVVSPALQAQNIQDQFDTFKKEASRWQEYTMFKHHELDNFWKIVSDTLQKNRTDLVAAKNNIKNLSKKQDSLSTTLQQTREELEASEEVNASIGFLGIQVNKFLYNTIVWMMIAGLCIVIGVLYLMYTKSHSVTQATKKDYNELATEFGEYKEKVTKKQISLKRELQTAINTLEENRIKVSQKIGYNKDSSTIS